MNYLVFNKGLLHGNKIGGKVTVRCLLIDCVRYHVFLADFRVSLDLNKFLLLWKRHCCEITKYILRGTVVTTIEIMSIIEIISIVVSTRHSCL